MGKDKEDKGVYIIRFSADDIYVDGKSLKDAIEEDVKRMTAIKIVNNQMPEDIALRQEMEENLRFMSEENIVSKRRVEKNILQALISKAMAEKIPQAQWNILNSILDDVENAEESVEIDKRYWKQITDSFDKFKPEEKEKSIFFWKNCRELFKQLEVPEEKKVPEENK